MGSELFTNLIQDFKTAYKYYKRVEYVEDKGDERSIGLLLAKLRILYPKHNTEQMRNEVRDFFVAGFTVSPSWIKDTPTMKLFNSQFNAIREAQIKVNPVKKYDEENQSENYINGNKKTTFSKGTPKNLGELLQNFTIDK